MVDDLQHRMGIASDKETRKETARHEYKAQNYL